MPERVLAVVQVAPGELELNYSWLPTWIGMNAGLKKEIEEALSEKLVGLSLNEEGLMDAHTQVIDFLVQRFPQVNGLRDYLEALRFVSFK